MKTNLLTQTDSYKLGHYNMYPKGTTKVYSYFEARKGAKYDKTVFFSLQYLLKEYFVGKVVTQEQIDKADKLVSAHLGPGVFNKEGWQYILDEYDGKLPLSINAVQEGSFIDVDNVLFTVENTDPKCFWLTNYVESILTHVWYGSTVATKSKTIKDLMDYYLNLTSDNPEDFINFMLHDFGYRGATSTESASVGGAAHLLNFMGTDTVPGIEFLIDYYDADVCGFSVPATEHSIATAEGKEGEFDVVKNLFKEYPKGILSLVIDSYDYVNFVKVLGTDFKNTILKRDGVTVFRPDSGDPVNVSLEVMTILGKYFGYTINKKGFKVLNPKVKLLWGDGIDIEGISNILVALVKDKWSIENIIFGMGGALHQKVNRDTQRFAFKSSYQVQNGVGKNIYKDPIDKSKASKRGRLALIRNADGKYHTMQELEGKASCNLLREVFRDGELLIEYTLDEIKANIDN